MRVLSLIVNEACSAISKCEKTRNQWHPPGYRLVKRALNGAFKVVVWLQSVIIVEVQAQAADGVWPRDIGRLAAITR